MLKRSIAADLGAEYNNMSLEFLTTETTMVKKTKGGCAAANIGGAAVGFSRERINGRERAVRREFENIALAKRAA